jgi:hypothetical protein
MRDTTALTPAYTPDDGDFNSVDDGRQIRGALISFADKQWFTGSGKYKEELPAGTRLVVVGVRRGWKHWRDGEVVEFRQEVDGHYPRREELGDLDEATWECGLTDSPTDPWQDSREAVMVNPDDYTEYTYCTSSGGGRRACDQLAGETEPVPDGAAVLNLARDYRKKYVAHPSPHALVAHTLLCAHTHLLEAFDSTPRGAFLSAFPESGKTRALEATAPLVCRPVSTVNASSNYLFRKAGDDAGPPTVLFDEIDTIFGPKAKEHEDIRGFINAGHRKGATYGRCRVVGNSVLTEDLPCYAAVMMGGLGWLPDTLLSRSVVIRMHRRLKSEKVAQFRGRTSIPEGEAIGAQLAVWARSVFADAVTARPEMPEGVEDRQADAWEPLLVVADLAGGEWPELAREAAVALVKVNRETPPSLKLRLLQDSRLVFFQNLQEAARARPKGLLTEMVLSALHDLEDAPWKTINKGEPFTSVELRNRFFDYGVEPEQLRPCPGDNHTQRRGYPLGPFALAWRRYLPPLCLRPEAVTAVTGVTREVLDEYFDWVLVDDDGKPVTDVTGVTGFSASERDQGETDMTDVTASSPRERDQETEATPNQEAAPDSGAPNIAKILDLPSFKPRR